jgi:CRISPR/Cas system CSM-associated protein Csm3 (group 7 of RAMP superfamily)
MSEIEGFEAIVISGGVRCGIMTKSPLTIGAGKSPVDPLAPDIPLLRDSRGRPVIPGSTIKGFFRSGIERTLSALNIKNYSSLIESLFGTTRGGGYGSRLLFSDAYTDRDDAVELREHIKINPSTMAVEHGPFTQEYVKPETSFSCEISFRNIPPSFLSLLSPVIKQADMGVAKLGRSKSRGYGHVSISLSDVLIGIAWPPDKDAFSLLIKFLDRSIKVDLRRAGGKVSISDSVSNCELTCDQETEPPFLRARIRWLDVEKCLEPLIRGLSR